MPVIVAITAWNNGATSLWCSVTYGSEGGAVLFAQ